MSSNMTRFTFWGICQYDPTILEAIQVPTPLDRQILIDEIMKRSGSLYVYQQQPEYLKQNISNWFTRNAFNFQKQIEALQAEFNPIENYDRYEIYQDTGSDSHSSSRNNSSNASVNNSNSSESSSSSSSSGDTTNQVSAFNESTFTNANKSDSSDSASASANSSGSSIGSSSNQSSEISSDTTTYGKGANNHIHGNIGVTTATAMINEAVSLYDFDLYTNIAQRFEKEFLVQVY